MSSQWHIVLYSKGLIICSHYIDLPSTHNAGVYIMRIIQIIQNILWILQPRKFNFWCFFFIIIFIKRAADDQAQTKKKSKVPLELSKEFLILFRISGCILLPTIKSQSFVIVCKKEQQQCRIIPINQFFKVWYANIIAIDLYISQCHGLFKGAIES